MKQSTALKTGRSAAQQADALPARAFTDYVAMVERLSAGYFRPLRLRRAAQRRPN